MPDHCGSETLQCKVQRSVEVRRLVYRYPENQDANLALDCGSPTHGIEHLDNLRALVVVDLLTAGSARACPMCV